MVFNSQFSTLNSQLLKMEFPALVEHVGAGYEIRPLLMPGPVVTRARYADAMRAFHKAIRNLFKHQTLDRLTMENALWYRYAPDCQFENTVFVFKSGLHHIEGHFAVASYTLNGHRYACFPKLDYLTLRIDHRLGSREHRQAFLTQKLTAYFRELRKELGAEDGIGSANFKQYLSKPSAAMISVNTTVEVKSAAFPFESEPGTLWAFLSENSKFDGARELEKVAEDCSSGYPDEREESFFRDSERAWLDRALFSGRAQAVAVVGASGVGKSNLIKHVYEAHLDRHRTRPLHRQQKLWLVDPLRVISGMSVVGQWERRFEAILKRIRDRLKEITDKPQPDILYIDNPVALLRIGKSSQSELTLAHVLMPYLERRDLPLVLEATPQEWQKLQQLNRGFADMFQVLRLSPLAAGQNDFIYTRRRAELERRHRCEFTAQAVVALIKAEPGFRGNKELPGSLLEIMADIAIKSHRQTITENQVYLALQNHFHINRVIIDRNQTLDRRDLADFFAQNLIGQSHAGQILVDTVLTIKAQLTQPGKPLSTLLFIGPTGVGKTEAAKLLARYLFSRQEGLVRIDMNEFIDEGAVGRLIGDAYNPYGILTEQVRYQKFCVLLLDEIEKAHHRVHDLLLQLLDDGRLTDALGNTTDFSQAVIIMTSNVGAQEAASRLGFVTQDTDISATYVQSLEKYFLPEMVNRINHIVVFEPLQRDQMQHLARLHLRKILQRDGFLRRCTILNVDELCLTALAERSYDPRLGARALKRNLERAIAHATAAQLAEFNSKDPVILNLWIDGGRVQSELVHLTFTTRLAGGIPPSVTFELADYKRARDLLQTLEDELAQGGYRNSGVGGEPPPPYEAWTLADAIRDIKEPLQSFIYELEERLATQRIRVAPFFRPAPAKYYEKLRMPRIDFSGIHAHQDIRDYLNSVYQKTETFFDSEKSNQLQLWVDINRLLHTCYRYRQRGVDRGTLVLRSLVAHKGEFAVNYLALVFRELLERYGQVSSRALGEGGQVLEISGPGMEELLAYESGIHLFYEEKNTQVPVLVRFYAGKCPADIPVDRLSLCREGGTDILRIYALAESRLAEGTITDLRTGLMSDAALVDSQWWTIVSPAYPDYLFPDD